MAHYYKTRPRSTPLQSNTRNHAQQAGDTPARVLSEFDKLREKLLTTDAEEGWASELHRYLGTMQQDVTKDTDIVEWWQVRLNPLKCFSTLIIILQDNAKLYPTLARIALDILPS